MGQTVTQGASSQWRQDFGEVDEAGRALIRLDFVGVDAVEEGAFRGRAVGVGVVEAGGLGGVVPALAGDDAGVTADADVEVDDEAELAVGGGGRAVMRGV